MKDSALIARYGRARRDRALAVLEGFHALKHAMRFGAQLVEVSCSNPRELERLAAEFAPELAPRMLELTREVPQEVFSKLAPLEVTFGAPLLPPPGAGRDDYQKLTDEVMIRIKELCHE